MKAKMADHYTPENPMKIDEIFGQFFVFFLPIFFKPKSLAERLSQGVMEKSYSTFDGTIYIECSDKNMCVTSGTN